MEKTIDFELKRGDCSRLLREMEVGDIFRFPITKHNTVRACVSNTLIVERSEGHEWRVSADLDAKQSVVTRVS